MNNLSKSLNMKKSLILVNKNQLSELREDLDDLLIKEKNMRT